MTRLFFLFSFLILICTGCWRAEPPPPAEPEVPEEVHRRVLVTVAPYGQWIKEITDGQIEVTLLIPPGADAHTYEPTPKQVLEVAKSDIWFTIGEPLEQQLLPRLKEQRPGLWIGHLGGDTHGSHGHDHEDEPHEEHDVHIWLSPPRVKAQVGMIAELLSSYYPEHADRFARNANALQERLERLDREIGWLLRNSKGKTVLVSHPALGYFCEDYFLKQLSIEHHGGEPTPRVLTEVLQQAEALNIETVFLIPLHNPKGARLVALELGAELVIFNPFAEDYAQNLKALARKIARD